MIYYSTDQDTCQSLDQAPTVYVEVPDSTDETAIGIGRVLFPLLGTLMILGMGWCLMPLYFIYFIIYNRLVVC
jgi:hypothetical protein